MSIDETSEPRPLTAELINSSFNSPVARIAKLERFFKSVLKSIEHEVQGFHTTPIKCSVNSVELKTLPPQAQGENMIRFACGSDELRIWFDAERDFDMLLVELCLGGTGLSPKQAETDRPASKFERRLRAAVAAKLFQTLPEAARLAHSVEWAEAGPQPPDAVLKEPRPENCVCLTILMNAFTFTSEFSILFHQAELEKTLQLEADGDELHQKSVRPALDGCPFELQVFLKPLLVPIDKILNVKPGEFIALNTTIASPVSIHLEEAHIFDGVIELGNDAINVQLAQPAPAEIVKQNHAK